ncbi:hypothetical protein L0Y40_01095 [Candidatus Wolfebacteria bacterium]|nr:hypothetical protein [Candidatus Wolfebacteria bacterium]
MIIEFFGVPGAGKTSGARYLSSELGIPFIKGGEDRVWDAVAYIINHPLKASFFFLVATRQTLHSETWPLFRWRTNTILGTLALLHRATSQKSDTIVDEGLLQRVLSVYEEPLTEERSAKIVKFLSPEFVVYISDTKREFQRYNDSAHPRQRFGDEYMDRWKATVRKNTKLLYQALLKEGIPHIVTDDSHSPRFVEAMRLGSPR